MIAAKNIITFSAFKWNTCIFIEPAVFRLFSETPQLAVPLEINIEVIQIPYASYITQFGSIPIHIPTARSNIPI